MSEKDAAQQEREMREHEREARERDPDERSPDGDTSPGAAGGEEPAPPGQAGRGSTTST